MMPRNANELLEAMRNGAKVATAWKKAEQVNTGRNRFKLAVILVNGEQGYVQMSAFKPLVAKKLVHPVWDKALACVGLTRYELVPQEVTP